MKALEKAGMSLAVVHTRARLGIEAPKVQVEVHLSNGLPALNIAVEYTRPARNGREGK